LKQFLPASLPGPDGIIRLCGNDYNYLVRVRRLKPGKKINAILPDGTKSELTILSVSDGTLAAQCGTPNQLCAGNSSIPPISIFQALPKGAKMDLIIRQATECGISEIAPFESEHSQVKADVSAEKLRRWERIIREARQQSGSPVSTMVKTPFSFDALLDYWDQLIREKPEGLGMFLHQSPVIPLEPQTFHHYLSNSPCFIVLVVGPEGGFSSSEAARFITAGIKPVSLGDNILRTETAALYGAAAVRVLLSENASWLAVKTQKQL